MNRENKEPPPRTALCSIKLCAREADTGSWRALVDVFPVALLGDLVEGAALGGGAPDDAHHERHQKEATHDDAGSHEARRGFHAEARHGHERPDAQNAAHQKEHDALHAAAIQRREQLRRPQRIAALGRAAG